MSIGRDDLIRYVYALIDLRDKEVYQLMSILGQKQTTL